MQHTRSLPREVLGSPLDVIAPDGGFQPLIESMKDASSDAIVLQAHDRHGNDIIISVPVESAENLTPARGQEVFIEDCTVTLLDELGDNTGIQANAWISLNPEVKTAGLPAGKLIIWNPHHKGEAV